MSCVEILIVLLWDSMRIDPLNLMTQVEIGFSKQRPRKSVYLQALAHRKFINLDELETFGQDGSFFHEHPPKPGYIKGVEAGTDPNGFSMALGMALAGKVKGIKYNVYVILGDGECNEGVIWECALVAPAFKVNNLIGIIDYNKLQATGRSNEITSIDPLALKWKAFGWHVQEIDGHNINEIKNAIDTAKNEVTRPSMIIAHTVKGKGISFMEDDNNWHYRTPNSEELAAALAELKEDQL